MDIKNIENIYECSPLQKGMLFHAVHQPNTTLYIEQVRFALPPDLEKSSFRAAWEKTIERHSALRTTFHWQGTDQPLQVVYRKVPFCWNEERWNTTSFQCQDEIELFAENVKKEGFNLIKGPLLNFHLIQLKDGFEFIWTFHHLIMDGWSMPLVLQDILQFYMSEKENKPVYMDEASQFHEYISWLDRQDMQQATDFFQKKLEGYNEPSYFTDAGSLNKNEQIIQDRYMDCIIPQETSKQLKGLAQRQNVTLFTVLQSMWILLINSHTNQEDIVVGTVMSGRRPELRNSDKIVGPFINTLPLRVKLGSEDTLESVIQKVQKEQSEISQFEYTPLYEVQKVSELKSGIQLFDNIIVFENYPFDLSLFSSNDGLKISRFQVEEKSNFPISLAIILHQESLLLRIHYATSVISEQEIAQILQRMAGLLKEAHRNLLQPIGSIEALSKEDLEHLHKWEGEQLSVTEEMTNLHEQFEKQSYRYSEKIAVRSESKSYTYGELNVLSDMIAACLQHKGIKKEEPVAVYMERSADIPAAILGILKAGGVYVPLDTHMPEERIKYILEDSRTNMIITGERTIPDYLHDFQNISMKDIPNDGVRQNVEVHSGQSAYLMYTSGSTGKPKGVMVSHRAALQHYLKFKDHFKLNPQDRVLQFGTITFDPSLEQIFPTLFSGGEVMIRGESIWGSDEFVDQVNKNKITIANLPTPYWNEIVNHFRITGTYIDMPSLRMLAVGGDKLSKANAETWNSVHKGKTELYNFYGPTEIVTTCTYLKVPKELPAASSISIGVPLPNRKLSLLDDLGRRVPPGRKGEIFIRGPILANGYLNNPRLTAERFLPDPYSTVPGARMYQTGDFGRYLPNSEVEFLGRNDDQLKIRGFRIETGEIEKVLQQITEVKQAVVTVEMIADQKTLLAYVTSTEKISDKQIKETLQQKLPDYMIPRHIQVLSELPLLTNGKIDRKALPIPDFLVKSSYSYIPPSNLNQERMAQIWQDVLRAESVGIRDNFFELGGDSILALQISARCQEASIELTTKDIFEYQTIEKIDEHLSSKKESQEWEKPELIFQENVEDVFTPIQNWFFTLHIPNVHHWNQSVFVKANKDIQIPVLKQAIEYMIAQHEVFKYSFIQQNGKWIQKEENDNRFIFEEIDCSGEEGLAKERQVIRDAQSSLNIESGPLLKVLCFRDKEKQEYRIFLTIHHLIVDGVSWRILLDDLERAYTQLMQGNQVKLPEETITYKEWRAFLKHYACSEKLEKELPYWKKISNIEMKIPCDRQAAMEENTEGSVRKTSLVFTKEETQTMLTGARQSLNAKIQEILIAALAVTLRKWTGKETVKIDLESHGREELDTGLHLNNTVGWFTSLYPFSVSFENRTSLLQNLTDTITALKVIPQNGIGYGIMKYLTDEEFKEIPAEVSFNYLGQLNGSLKSEFFELLNQDIEPIRDPKAKREYLLDVEGAIVNGQLQLDWIYSGYFHSDETIEKLTEEFTRAVKGFIALSESFNGKKYHPGEFTKVNLNEKEWEQINQYPYEIEDIYPLTPAQSGMLFHTLLHPESGVYIEQMAFEIHGGLSVESFVEAWEHVLSSHSILRANVLWDGFSKPIHVINRSNRVKVNYLDWSKEDRNMLEKTLYDLKHAQRVSGYELEKEPLMKLTLIKLQERSYYFIWTYHHLLLDGWSMPKVLEQLSNTYSSLIKGKKVNSLQLPSFGDFAFHLSQQNSSDSEAVWKGLLSNWEERGLLFKKEEVSEEEPQNKEIKRKLSASLTQLLRDVASEEKTTLNTAIQTAWSILLSVITRKENVLFGSVFSGRDVPVKGIEEMTGMFINTLPVKIMVSDNCEIGRLLADMHTVQIKMSERQNTSLTEIKEMIEYNSKDSLFDTCLIFANFPNLLSPDTGDAILEGVSITNIEATEQTNFPLTLSIAPEERMSLDINYNSTVIDHETIELYLDLLEMTLIEMSGSIRKPVGNITSKLKKLITEREQEWAEQRKERNRSSLNKMKKRRIPQT